MCDSFSEFFAHKVRTFAQTVVDRYSVITSIPPLFDEPVNSVSFNSVSELKVKKVIHACPSKISPFEFIPISMTKDSSDIFSRLICKLANLSFAKGVLVDVFKVGPLIKKTETDVSVPVNYCPVVLSGLELYHPLK